MPTVGDTKRDAARRLFDQVEAALRQDETLQDKDTLGRMIDKAEEGHRSRSRKRFDAQDHVRQRFIYPVVDSVLDTWCRKQGLRADPFNCFKYKGKERGPTQHETAIGPSENTVRHYFERIADASPLLGGEGAAVLKATTQAPAPDFRFQAPLPFGAAGDCVYSAEPGDLVRALHRTAMYVAVGGDLARGWRYDCGLVLFCASSRVHRALGEDLFDAWPDVCDSLWRSTRVRVCVF